MTIDATAPTLRDFMAAWDLFRDPVIAGVIAGGTLGYLGVYIVLRRMVFVSAALSQAAGLGVALAFYAQIALGAAALVGDPMVMAMALTIVTLLFLMRRGSERWLSHESLLGAVYLVGGAGALLVGTKIRQEAHDIQSILFGAAVLVTHADLHKLELVAAGAVALQIVAGRGLRFASFDPDGARIRGLPVRLLDMALFVSIAVSVSVSTRLLGALPVFAFSVLPAMAALLLAPNVRGAMAIAAVCGAVAGGAGYVAAFLYTWPVGASQTALAAGLLVVAGILRATLRMR
ncbi:Zinc ABC transporter, inner membrane permease protein ZnuB [Minicystis rosea]|nr:Zinc ABC transporter, inner membrane permease protein ZnuB [Minicystis rosea]